jgi:hypothetical protein
VNPLQIISGNAQADGAPFKSWFVGDFKAWMAMHTAVPAESAFALRQSRVVEMKWSAHRAGETRADWALCSDKHTMSLLVRGKFLLRFRTPDRRTQITERRLEREGDYALWGIDDVEHTWLVEEDAVIFTVRWRESS